MASTITEIKERYSKMVEHRDAHKGRIEDLKTEDWIAEWLEKQLEGAQ